MSADSTADSAASYGTASDERTSAARTTRMGSGLAIAPEKNLAMFAEMARKGKHLDGVTAGGHGWSFRDGVPEDAIFELTYESDPTPEYFDIFRAAGWTSVLSLGNMHIFKAAPGTPPVHSGVESRREELHRQPDPYVRYAVISVVAFVGALVVLALVSWPWWVEVLVYSVFVIPVAYTVIPLLGYMRQLGRLGTPTRA